MFIWFCTNLIISTIDPINRINPRSFFKLSLRSTHYQSSVINPFPYLVQVFYWSSVANMELHPFLERNMAPNPDLWYVLSAFGDFPSMRVGHSCSYIPGPDGHGGKVYVIGGANPSGTFAETYCLDLDTFTWDSYDSVRLKPRYEHAAFVPRSQPSKIYIFGGADQGGNNNDIQVFDTTSHTWSVLTAGGTAPSPRTYHTTACVGDRFIVYSGGQSGSDPVGDRQVHCFDASSQEWSTLNIHGESPKPRHGHLVAAVGNKIIVHGGMSGTTFYDDLHVLDIVKKSWTSIKQKKVFPCARAAHGGFVQGSDLYVFGGMNREGALHDMFKLDTSEHAWYYSSWDILHMSLIFLSVLYLLPRLCWTQASPELRSVFLPATMKWSRVTLEGPPPASRLDFACCIVRLAVPIIPPATPEELGQTSQQAIEILGQQFRMGSAGSGHSVGSAGSTRSVGSLGSAGSQRGDIEVLSTGQYPNPLDIDISYMLSSPLVINNF